MGRHRPSLVEGDLKAGKEGARQWIDAGGFRGYSEATLAAAKRLLEDERASTCWRHGFGAYEFEHAVHCYELASIRDVWMGKSKREREIWQRDFDRTLARLLALLEEGPVVPSKWGFPVRDFDLAKVFAAAGYSMPDRIDVVAFRRRVSELEEAADATGWNLADSLKHYQLQVAVGGREQLLKKPRDPQAHRADFITTFKISSECSTDVVATVAAVMFDDEAIDDRLVRRLTAPRADS